jgi:hypothetical protein
LWFKPAEKIPLPTAFLLLRACLLWPSCDILSPFPSNGCLCWLHSSCVEQICHNILHQAASKITLLSPVLSSPCLMKLWSKYGSWCCPSLDSAVQLNLNV